MKVTSSEIKIVAQHRKLASEIDRLRTFLERQRKDKSLVKYPSDEQAAKTAVKVLDRLRFFFSNLEKFKNDYLQQLKDFHIHKDKVEDSDFISISNYRRRLVSLMMGLMPHLEGFLAYMEKGMDDVSNLNSMLEELKKIEKEQSEMDTSRFAPWDKTEVLEQDKELFAASLGTVSGIQALSNKVVASIKELHELTY